MKSSETVVPCPNQSSHPGTGGVQVPEMCVSVMLSFSDFTVPPETLDTCDTRPATC